MRLATPVGLIALVSSSLCIEEKRQLGADGGLTASNFVRRGFHASTVANNWVYIDGGEVSYRADNGSIQYRYSTTLEAIDLSSDWTNSTVTVHSIPKPSDVPDLEKAGLWYDNKRNTLYSGFAGRASYINNGSGGLPPYPPGIWQFKPNGDANSGFNQTIASTDALWESIIRPVSGLISYGGGKGYVLGGASSPNVTDDQVPAIGGMLVFDFDSRTLLNVSSDGSQFGDGIHMGGMVYVPNFGSNGVFVVVGGEDANLELLSLDEVSVYDPVQQKWYAQSVTGTIPKPRKAHCIAGIESAEGSFEIFMFGGWTGRNTAANLPYDEIFVLSLPAFEWIQVKYPPKNPRHTVTCQAVGGSQILTIGGLASDSTADPTAYIAVFDSQDPFAQGLAVFDMEVLAWKDKYEANLGAYHQASAIQDIYAKGNTTKFNNAAVATLFSNTTVYRNSPSSKSNHRTNVGTVVGGVVGGVVGLAIIAAAVFFLWRRKKSSKRAELDENAAQHHHEQHPLYEAPGKNSREYMHRPDFPEGPAPAYELHQHSQPRAYEVE